MKSVTISLVTWNSFQYLPKCLEYLKKQIGVILEIIVFDNNSNDGSLDYLKKQTEIRLISSKENVGFCKAHNTIISQASNEYILVLNPDVFLSDTFLLSIVEAIELDEHVGQVSGKLYRISDIDEIGKNEIIDTTGIYFSPNQRHFDRGAGEQDKGQYDQIEYIFGVSAAAVLFRKKALSEVVINNEYFDSSFFAYREDADLSWRMQLYGWKAIYTPFPIAYHVRSLREGVDRSGLNPVINMHSVKNRFLMRIKNQTWQNSFYFFFPILIRDILIIGYILLVERSSLYAFILLGKYFPKMIQSRKIIMKNKKVTNSYIKNWFLKKSSPFRNQD